jgi:hypothetical protein
LATISVVEFTFVVSPYAGPNLEVFAEEVLPELGFRAFILALKQITYDLLTGLDSMHGQVSKGLKCTFYICHPLVPVYIQSFPGCRWGTWHRQGLGWLHVLLLGSIEAF